MGLSKNAIRSDGIEQLRRDVEKGKGSFLSDTYLQCRTYCFEYLQARDYLLFEDFDDLYNDAIIVFRRKLVSGQISNLQNIKSYLLGICINLAKESRARYLRKASSGKVLFDIYYAEKVSRTKESTSDALVRLCEIALNQLKGKHRDILQYFYFEQRTLFEISKIMGLSSPDVAKTMKSRSLKKWRMETHKLLGSQSMKLMLQ